VSQRTTIADNAIEDRRSRVVVLVLTFPSGRQLFLGERQISIPWAAESSPFQVYGGLTQLASITQGVGSEDLSSMRFGFSADDVTIAVLQDTDFVPSAAVVDCFAIWPGQDYDDRERLLDDARITKFMYGIGKQAVAMEVRRDDEAVCLDIGDDRDQMWWYGSDFGGLAATTYDSEFSRRDQVGRMWPIALGRCYFVPGWQNYKAIGGNLLLVGHAIPTSASNIYDLDVYQSGDEAVMSAGGVYDREPQVETHTYQTDSAYRPGEARKYTYIDGTATSAFPPEDDWYHTHLIHGGASNELGETIIGANMVLEHLLRQSGMTIDWSRMARTLSELRGLDIGVYVDSQTNILELIRDRIAMPNGPVPIREQNSGKGKWWSYHEGWRRDPVAHLVDGQQIDLVGGVDLDMASIRNEVTVNYGYSYGTQKYGRALTVGADNYALASWSQTTYGRRPMDGPISTTIAGTPSTALALGRSALAQVAMPRRTMQGYLSRAYYWLQPGDVVMVESPAARYGVTAVKAEIIERPLALPGLVTLKTFEQVPQARS
jgi:hypothetical protein